MSVFDKVHNNQRQAGCFPRDLSFALPPRDLTYARTYLKQKELGSLMLPSSLPSTRKGLQSLSSVLRWRQNAELSHQTEKIQVDPVVGHLPVHDTKDARGLDVNCFASRGHALEGMPSRKLCTEM